MSLYCVLCIVSLCATLWTVAHQAPLSMRFSRQEHQSGLPCPPPGDLPNPGIEPRSPALAGRFLTTGPPGKLSPSYNGTNAPPSVTPNHPLEAPLPNTIPLRGTELPHTNLGRGERSTFRKLRSWHLVPSFHGK